MEKSSAKFYSSWRQGLRAAIEKDISVLGAWAGNPETATHYYPPIVTAPFNAIMARECKSHDVRRRSLAWHLSVNIGRTQHAIKQGHETQG